MGINVGKQKRVISAQEDNPNLEKEDSSLETIANEYMKQDSYRRSQNKYGVDLRADEIAEDVPVEARTLTMNSETLTTNDRSEQIYEDDEDDGYYSKQERERFEIMEVPTGLLHTEEPIRWQKGGMIGAGAFGKVYLGLHEGTGELLAVKQIQLMGDIQQQAHELESLEQEIDLMKDLQHENIVRYKGTSFEDNHLNIFLEYVPGGSLSSLLAKFGFFPESVIRIYTRQILCGLEYLHRHNIIHRDIKGANILLDKDGAIKLADFGASKKLQGLLNATGGLRSLKGTPYYMAPEVIRQTGHGRQADIWSVGCTVYEMLTGKPPYHEIQDQVSALFHIASATSPPALPPGLSTEAQDFLSLCFQGDPKARPNASRLLEHPFIVQKVEPSTHSTAYSSSPSPRASPRQKVSANSLKEDASVNGKGLSKSPQKAPSTPKIYPETTVKETFVKRRSGSFGTKEEIPPSVQSPDKLKTVQIASVNPVEEPSWAWNDEHKKNISFIESKLKNSPSSSPSDKMQRTAKGSPKLESDSAGDRYDVKSADGEVDEKVIKAFVRKSAVTGIKRLVSEGALLQSIRNTDQKAKNMRDEELIDSLVKKAERTRATALKASSRDEEED